MATDSHQGAKEPAASPKLICSFCGEPRSSAQANCRPLVNICDECVDVCNDVIDGECEHETPAGQASQQDATFNDGERRALCHLLKPSEELLAVLDRGFISTVCLDAVKSAAEEREEN